MIKEPTYHLDNILVALNHSFFYVFELFTGLFYLLSCSFSLSLYFSIFSIFYCHIQFSIFLLFSSFQPHSKSLSQLFSYCAPCFHHVHLIYHACLSVSLSFSISCFFFLHVFFFSQFASSRMTSLKLLLVIQFLCVFLCLWFEVKSEALDVMGVLTKGFWASNIELMVRGARNGVILR